MTDNVTNLYMTLFFLAKVVLAFYILYIFIPKRVITFDEYGDERPDKFMISLVHSNFIIIILVHILVALKVYETLSLLIAIIILISIIFLRRSAMGTSEKRSITAFLLDFIDGNSSTRFKAIKEYFASIPKRLLGFIKHLFMRPFDGILLLGVFVFAAAIRFSHAFTYLHYGASDCYVHLAWTKYLGINKIYLDGVYPYGYEAIISALQKLFFIDPAISVRFFGGIGSLILIFSIYYILRKNLSNRYLVIFLGVAAYVFGTEMPNYANDIWRQISALPQEYAAAFILPGLHFLNVFLVTNRKKYLVLAAEALAITVFIHFYAALFMGIGYAVLLLLNIDKVFKQKAFGSLALFLGGAGIIGISPIAIALGLGMKLHALSLGFVSESAKVSTTLDWRQEIFKYVEVSQALKLVLLCAAVMFAYAFVRLFFKKSPEYTSKISLFVTIAFLSAITYTQVRAVDIGFPSIMEFSRASTFFTIMAVTLLAMTVYLVEFFPVHKIIKYIGFMALSAVVVMSVFNQANVKYMFPKGAKLEYEQSVLAYYNIKKDYPVLNWTIISPVEQYQQSMGYGWHYNLWEFVKDIQIDKKAKESFPTDYVFVMVEKRPLNQAKPEEVTPPITLEDANKPFPEIGNALDKYYTNYENRRIIQAKAYYWMEDYMQRTGNFTVYYEDDTLKIYVLKQDGEEPINIVG